jgi:hypothetical protein
MQVVLLAAAALLLGCGGSGRQAKALQAPRGLAGRAAVAQLLLLLVLVLVLIAAVMATIPCWMQQRLQAVRVARGSLARARWLLVLLLVVLLLRLGCCVCVSGRWLGWWHSWRSAPAR